MQSSEWIRSPISHFKFSCFINMQRCRCLVLQCLVLQEPTNCYFSLTCLCVGASVKDAHVYSSFLCRWWEMFSLAWTWGWRCLRARNLSSGCFWAGQVLVGCDWSVRAWLGDSASPFTAGKGLMHERLGRKLEDLCLIAETPFIQLHLIKPLPLYCSFALLPRVRPL